MDDKPICPSKTAWYVCENGFRGCCPVNPCGLKQCPGLNSSGLYPPSQSSTGISSAAMTTTISTSATASSTTSKTTFLASTKTSPSPALTTESTTKTQVSANESDSGPTSSVSSSFITSKSTPSVTSTAITETGTAQPGSTCATPVNRDHNNAKMIGGIIGSVAGLLLVLCLLAYLLFRLSKKRGKRGFTLLHWRHPRMERPQAVNGRGSETTEDQAPDQTASLAVENPISAPSRPQERFSSISPLQGQTNSPQTIPSASSSSPNISPQTINPGFTPSDSQAKLVPVVSEATHPALRHNHPRPNPITIPKRTTTKKTSHPRTRIPSSPRELFDTGFRLGRLELPAFSTRELINIPFSERQRPKQQKHLRQTTRMHLPIVTRDGALLSSNFRTLPASPDCHAISFADHGPASPSAENGSNPRPSSRASSSSPPPLSPPPPSYRSSWRRGSSDVKEKVREKFRRKS